MPHISLISLICSHCSHAPIRCRLSPVYGDRAKKCLTFHPVNAPSSHGRREPRNRGDWVHCLVFKNLSKNPSRNPGQETPIKFEPIKQAELGPTQSIFLKHQFVQNSKNKIDHAKIDYIGTTDSSH